MSTATQHQQTPNSSSLRSLVARHPVVAFLIMVYAFGWSTLIAADSVGLPFLLVSSLGVVFGLALPAFLVTAATSGKAGVRALLGRCLRWRVGIGWYLLALLGLPLVTLLVANVFLGTAPLEALAQKWPLFFTMFLPSIFVPLVITHLFEETGWTGFMQDTLQDSRGPLLASILVAPAFALFHLPLIFLEAPPITLSLVPVALFQIAVQAIASVFFRVVIMWLYNSTGRSVLIVALFHSSFNSVTGSEYATRFIEEIIVGPAALPISLAVVVVVAVVVAVLTRGGLAYRTEHAARRAPKPPTVGPAD